MQYIDKDNISKITELAVEEETFNSELIFGFRAALYQKDFFILSKKSGRWLLWSYNNDIIAINDLSETEPELEEYIKSIASALDLEPEKNGDLDEK